MTRFIGRLWQWARQDRYAFGAFVLAVAAVVSLAIGVNGAVAGPQGETVTGTVTEVIEFKGNESDVLYDTMISYTNDGEQFAFRSGFGDETTEVGDEVTVYFDAENPEGTNSTEADRSESIMSYLLSALVVGAAAWVLARRSVEERWFWESSES